MTRRLIELAAALFALAVAALSVALARWAS
jgi:hypothetical protein